ncbi:RNA binding motif protein 12B [Cichlidogyrus casuarinus]|uniref:RNA binding motif protein 12B n=1 Tax=Cichlidogyrus casuarinus TaxID=1844966 RepID=A0ABD2QHW5_9PLAT
MQKVIEAARVNAGVFAPPLEPPQMMPSNGGNDYTHRDPRPRIPEPYSSYLQPQDSAHPPPTFDYDDQYRDYYSRPSPSPYPPPRPAYHQPPDYHSSPHVAYPPYGRDRPVPRWPPPANQGKRRYEDDYPPPECIDPKRITLGIEGATEYTVKVSATPDDMQVRDVFEFLKGCTIVPKFGLRFEEDMIGRWTGYIYVMLSTRECFERALACDRALFKGRPTSVVSVPISEYFNSYEPGFSKKVPKKVLHLLPPKTSRPIYSYFSDGYLELSPLPLDANEQEVVNFVGAPGLTTRDVRLVGYSPKDQRKDGCKAILRLPSSSDIQILLSAKQRSFRPKLRETVSLVPISKLQFEYFLQFPCPLPPSTSNTLQGVGDSSRERTCVQIQEIPSSVKESEIVSYITSLAPQAYEVFILNSSKEGALLSCKTAHECHVLYDELSNPNCVLKRKFPQSVVFKIKRSRMEELLRDLSAESHNSAHLQSPPMRNECRFPGPPRLPHAGAHRMTLPPPPSPQMYGTGYAPAPRRAEANRFRQAEDGLSHLHLSNLPVNYSNAQLAAGLRAFNPVFSSIRVYNKGSSAAGHVAFNTMQEAEAVMQHFYHATIQGNTIAARFDLNFHG